MPARKKASQRRRSVTKSKEWRPHSKQIKMVQLLNNPEDRRTKEDKCKEVGITPKTLWEWMKNPNFVTYRNAQMDKFTDGELPEIWKAHLLQCKRGNMEAIKTFYKMKKLDQEIQLKFEELKHKQFVDEERIKIERERLEMEKAKQGQGGNEIVEDDNFIDSIRGAAKDVWKDVNKEENQ